MKMLSVVIIFQIVCLLCGYEAGIVTKPPIRRIYIGLRPCNSKIKISGSAQARACVPGDRHLPPSPPSHTSCDDRIRRYLHKAYRIDYGNKLYIDDLKLIGETITACANVLNSNNAEDISHSLNHVRCMHDSEYFLQCLHEVAKIINALMSLNKTILEDTASHSIYGILESMRRDLQHFRFETSLPTFFCNVTSLDATNKPIYVHYCFRGVMITISNYYYNGPIVTMIFENDNFFLGGRREVISKIVDMTLYLGYMRYTPSNFDDIDARMPVSVYFNTTQPKEAVCGSWIYNSTASPIGGHWDIERVKTIKNGSLVECKTNGKATIALLKFPIDDYISSIGNNVTSTNLKSLSVYLQQQSSNINFTHIENISHVLRDAADQNSSLEYEQPFFQTVNTLMGLHKSIVENASTNSTDIILQSMDNILMQLSQTGIQFNNSLPYISYDILTPEASHHNNDYEHISHGVPIRIPKDVLNTTIITIFENSNLFPEGEVLSKVVDFKIWNVKYKLTSPVSVYLKMTKPNEVTCVFWKYGENGIPGNWSDDGVTTIKIGDLIECKSEHLTAFALLGVSDTIINNLSETDQTALQVISTIFCVVSLLGLTVFFVTTYAVKNWSKKRIFTIHLSCIIALEVFLLFICNIASIDNGFTCVFFGVVMHYLVLVKFTIMLLIAKMQYDNFVTILISKNRSNHAIWGALISYSIPIVIVGASVGIFSDKYKAGNVKFCYPKEEAFIFFLVVPITTILLINLFIFSLVMLNISNSISRNTKQKALQAKLAIMLFFMLGLAWIFSSLSNAIKTQWLQLMFIYIFIILSPLQGFAIFIFSVVMDLDARKFWMKSYEKFRSNSLASESTNNTASTGVFKSDFAQNVQYSSNSFDKSEGNSENN